MTTGPVNQSKGRRLDGWLKAAVARLLEGQCRLCADTTASGHALCSRCRAALPWYPDGCQRCADLRTPGRVCGACLRRPPSFSHVIAGFAYRDEVTRLIRRFKHRGDLSAGRLLAEELVATLPTDLPEALVPVPMDRRRLSQRGFNQAAEIARHLPGRPLHDLVERQGKATPQHVLTARQRRRNIRNAFRLRATPPARVTIVDDVVTSAATVRELARILARAGCHEIVVCSLARA